MNMLILGTDMDQTVSSTLITFLKITYGVCLVFLTGYGVYSISLSVLYLKNRRRVWNRPQLPPPQKWPSVTVQLPICNEYHLVERLLKSVTSLDYPKNSLQIQVLDDSSNATSDLLKTLVEEYQKEGINIQYLHRVDRTGYKAGNLTAGLESATGELIAIFDADFIPPRNWLKMVAPEFNNPKLGFVQTRWDHFNQGTNAVSQWASLGMDGHFIVEQTARSSSGLFIGFNGSAGLWRRSCIDSTGGWQWDTLAEDLDLSYRAQLAGWKNAYLPNVVVEAEVPTQMDAFKTQQYRWAKGSVQTLRKIGWKVIKMDQPFHVRLAALCHLCMYLPFPFMVLTLLLVLPVGLYAPSILPIFWWSAIAGFGPPLMYSLARTERLPHFFNRLSRLPGILLMGFGISLNCALGVISGLLFMGGVFKVTPKTDSPTAQEKISVTPSPVTWGELALGFYLLVTVYKLWPTVGLALAPWLLSSAAGFFLVSGGSIYQAWKNNQAASQRSKAHGAPAILP